MSAADWATLAVYATGWAGCTVAASRALNASDARREIGRRAYSEDLAKRYRTDPPIRTREPLIEPGTRALNVGFAAFLSLFWPVALPLFLLYRLALALSRGRLFTSAPERDYAARMQAQADRVELEQLRALAEEHGLKFPTVEESR